MHTCLRAPVARCHSNQWSFAVSGCCRRKSHCLTILQSRINARDVSCSCGTTASGLALSTFCWIPTYYLLRRRRPRLPLHLLGGITTTSSGCVSIGPSRNIGENTPMAGAVADQHALVKDLFRGLTLGRTLRLCEKPKPRIGIAPFGAARQHGFQMSSCEHPFNLKSRDLPHVGWI